MGLDIMNLKNSGYGLLALILIPVLLIGAYFGYWALARNSTTQRYKVNTNNQQYQSSLIAQQRDRVLGITQATDPGQKSLIIAQFCQIEPTLTQEPADLASFAAKSCLLN